MASNVFSAGLTPVQSSITNANVDYNNALDNFQPFSFFEYLKYSQQITTPELFSQGYNTYLHAWYAFKNSTPVVEQDEIRARYVDLLNDIAYNYTTSEEKRFLSNLDYDDPLDLAIAIPFYAQKLKEICLFYTKKRDTFKFRIEELKIKGSTFSIEKAIFQSIIDYFSTSDNGTIVDIASNLQINIVEYFDVYSEYFNIDPDASASDIRTTDAIRIKYLTSNTNAISANLFLSLNDTIIADIFNTPFYLKEIGRGLSISPQKLITQALAQAICSNQSLADILNTNVSSLSSNYDLKKKIIEKYIGTDFYYLSTNSLSQFVSGSLFKAQNPSGNLLNKRFASTASTPENDLRSIFQIGGYFKPDKLGIIQFATPNNHFSVNSAILEANKVYVFPDPSVYGNVDNYAYNTKPYPLIYTVDNTPLVKGLDQGFANGFIKSNEYMQNYYAYFSEPVFINSENLNVSAFDPYFLRIFNHGSFTSYAQDVYGNEYGVIKQVKRYNKEQTDETDALGQCITIDGHVFYDDYEGYGFNYALTGVNFDGSLRTGLTSQTTEAFPPAGGSFNTGYTASSAGMFYIEESFYTLYFREYSPYINCNTTDNLIASIKDGGSFTANNTELLPDVPSDSPAWNVNSKVYYVTLCDAGLSATGSTVPAMMHGALSSLPSTSSTNYRLLDGRMFPNEVVLTPDFNYNGYSTNFIDSVNPECMTVLQGSQELGAETLNDINALDGVLFVKNISTNTVSPLSSALDTIFSKYNANVKAELYSNQVRKVNMYYDSIAVTTNNYIVFDKIRIDDAGLYEKPGTQNNYINITPDTFSIASNPFFIEGTNQVWLYKTTLAHTYSASNVKTIYPQIYKYDVNSNKLEQKYPSIFTNESQISSIFANGLSGINIVQVIDAKLTYAALNDKFNATWIAVDLNGMSYVYSAWFDYKNDTIIFDDQQVVVYSPNVNNQTYNFYYSLSNYSNVSIASAGSANIYTLDNLLHFN